MSRDEANALLALKNAWQGVVTSAGEVSALLPAVEAVADDAPLASIDLEAYYRVTAAHATATGALHGLIQELQRKVGTEE
jgi:hypothetical protein